MCADRGKVKLWRTDIDVIGLNQHGRRDLCSTNICVARLSLAPPRQINYEHRHSGIGYMTPAAMRTGQATALYAARQAVLEQAFGKYPERFKHRLPQPPALPTQVGINLPKPTEEQNNAGPNVDSKLLQAVSQSS